MRAVLAILPLLFLSDCANPWAKVPEAELPKPIRYVMARPSPFVIGNYCGPGRRRRDGRSAWPTGRRCACRG
ncbi:hypothetical protein EN852_038630, partial [Mesorhizobium sp. M2E.F.Ca.ET.209.01.1.1]